MDFPLQECHDTFKSVTKHPEIFLKQQNEKADKIKGKLLEKIYEASKSLESGRKSKSLPKLITDLDEESIWQQLELQNEQSFQSCLKNVSRFLAASTDKFNLNIGDVGEVEEDEEEDSENSEDGEEQEEAEDEEDSLGGEEESEAGDDDDEEEEAPEPMMKRKPGRKSVVDDQFFKLSEMEQFLEREDKRAMDPSHDDGGEEIDMFEPDETNREESLKYSDFFDKNEEMQEDDGEEEEEADDEDFGAKSSHELKQDRLKKKIEAMENAMLDDKPWQMKGEVKGDNRPQNSLLEEVLEFDSTTRPAPIITEEVTMKLEDIIRQRIKDKAFDDVERKVRPSDVQTEFKKQLVLDQEKSKQSLAQIYEKEFIDQLEKVKANGDEPEPEEPKEHKQIRAELKDLFQKLDLLSNFYYTPRPAQPDLKIITNLPTISMEEVAPVAVSDAAMLAPEEIKRKPKGDVIGEGERTKSDKNRERRHKKVFQQKKFSKKRFSGQNLVEKVTKSRNVEKMKTGETTKSSADFFSKLQDNVALEKSWKANKKRKGEKPTDQAKKLKL